MGGVVGTPCTRQQSIGDRARPDKPALIESLFRQVYTPDATSNVHLYRNRLSPAVFESCYVRSRMDAGQALAELTEISSQIEFALIFDARGELVGATLADRQRAESLAFGAVALLACSTRAAGSERGEPVQVELAYSDGSLLFVSQDDLRIVARTTPNPISGLAFFELRACLRKLTDAKPRWHRLGALTERLGLGARTSESTRVSSNGGEDPDEQA